MNITIGSVTLIGVGLLLLWLASKVILKLLGFVLVLAAVLGIMYYYSWGPFKQDALSLAQLEERYCGPDGDPDICDCIINQLKSDVEARFSQEEWERIEANRAQSVYVLKKSMDATKESSMRCLAAKGAEDKYEDFLKGFLPMSQEQWKQWGDRAERWLRSLEKELDGIEDVKDSLDVRYP